MHLDVILHRSDQMGNDGSGEPVSGTGWGIQYMYMYCMMYSSKKLTFA